eukprot:gene25055-31465_t
MNLSDFADLDALKARLDELRPLPPAALRNLHEKLVLRWTYHSNAIEGNTLTLMETKVVLEGITVGGKLLREHFEAINHRDAISYVEDVVRRAEPLSEWQIRNLHRLALDKAHVTGDVRDFMVLVIDSGGFAWLFEVIDLA